MGDLIFTTEHLNRVFPFYFEVDLDLNIVSVGRSLLKLTDKIHSKNLNEVFKIERPYMKTIEIEYLYKSTNELIILKGIDVSDFILRGQFEFFENRNTFVFIGTPLVQSVEKLESKKLFIKDFAVSDPTFDLLHVIKNIEINTDEIKQLLVKLKEKSDLIKKSEAQYKSILNLASDIIYKTDSLGNFIYCNKAAEKISGYSSSELLTKHYSSLIRQDYKKKTLFFYYNQLKNNVTSTYFEFPIITKSGEERWFGQSVQLIKKESDCEFIALVIDITKQKENEFQLIEANKKMMLLQTLINNTSDAIQVSTENGQMVYINNEASKRLGIDVNKISEFNVKDFEKIFHNNDEFWKEHVNEVKSKGTLIIEGENLNRLTNHIYPVEVTVRYIEINAIGYIIATSRDITERKIIQDTINKQKEKYQNIIANMNLGLLEVDLEDKIQYVNPGFERISGYAAKELIGKSAGEILLTDSFSDLSQQKLKQRAKGISDMYEIPIKNKNGDLKWWMISGAPNYDNDGKLIGSIGIHLDITEQKELELQLELAKSKAEESSKAKEAFLANMSHEIRTPLNAIIGMIRELSKEILTQKQSQFVHNTSVASQHLLSVLNNILDISKIEAGELQLDIHHFDIVEIFNDIMSIMTIKANEKNIYLKVNNPKNVDHIFLGDSSRLRQVFLNLIGNAIKFTHDGGITIDYTVEYLKNDYYSVIVIITDSGVGMEESYLKNIFNKFSQEDTSTSRKYGGSGLGMAITYELIQLMNGSINIESEKNKGTSVTVNLLLQKGNLDLVETTDIIEESNVLEDAEILLVEDNEFNRAVAGNTLSYYKCKITEAVDGEKAVDILKSGKKFDLILMDLQMPILDGFDATKIIRNDLKVNTPIVALTANAFKSELEQCMKIGMNDYVTKPFDEETLIKVMIKSMLSGSNIKDVKVSETKEQALYDLNKLISLSRNDNEYVKKMVNIFIDQSTFAIKQINSSYANGDLVSVSKIVHKIKPSIDGMDIKILYDEVRDIEKLTANGENSDGLKNKIQYFSNTLNKIIILLKSEVS
jgi:PAS domain S-box-containing protein